MKRVWPSTDIVVTDDQTSPMRTILQPLEFVIAHRLADDALLTPNYRAEPPPTAAMGPI